MPPHRRAYRRRGALERLLAWLYTGPLGHFYSVLIDVAVFWTRLLVARARRRPGGGAGASRPAPAGAGRRRR